MSQFTFLQAEFPAIYKSANKAFSAAHPDPRTACFYARRALELTVNWLYKYDNSLKLPYQDNLSALIHEPTFKTLVGEAVFNKTRVIIKLGNQAVHSAKPVLVNDAINAVRELFHVTYWLAHTYGRSSKPKPGLTFNPDALPKTVGSASLTEHSREVSERSRTELQKLETQLRDRDEKLSTLLADKNALDEELKQLRAEVAAVKQASTSQPDTHDYSEAQTRDIFIDLLLKEAGWKLISTPLNQQKCSLSEVEGNTSKASREFAVTGMPNASGEGFVDYVLWGDDGKPQ